MSESEREVRAGRWAAAALLVILTAVVYARVTGFEFVAWDDDRMLYLNQHVQGLSGENLKWMFSDSTYNRLYMPLGWLSYALSVAVVRLRAGAHHLINVALHAVNALLVFEIVLAWLRRMSDRQDARVTKQMVGWAFVGAAFWALHPLRVEVGGWVGARVHAVAAVFALSSALIYFRSMESGLRWPFGRKGYWGALLLYGVSVLAFPAALMLPAVYFVVDLYVSGRWRGVGDLGRVLRLLAEKIPYAVMAGIPAVVSLWGRMNTQTMTRAATLEEFSILERGMQACYVWIHYLWKTVLPVHLSPVYTRLWKFDPWDGDFVWSLLAVVGVTAFLFSMRKRWAGLWAAWVSYLMFMLPFLGLTEHPHYTSDRYTYIESVIWSVLIACGGMMLWQRGKGEARRILAGAAAAMLAVFVVVANVQTGIWHDSVTLFRYMIAEMGNDPYRADIYWRLGRVYLAQDRVAEAETCADETLKLAHKHPIALEVKATAAFKLGQLAAANNAPAEEVRKHFAAAAEARTKLLMWESNQRNLVGLMEALEGAGMNEQALEWAKIGVERWPGDQKIRALQERLERGVAETRSRNP